LKKKTEQYQGRPEGKKKDQEALGNGIQIVDGG